MPDHSDNNSDSVDTQRQHPLAAIYLGLMRDWQLWTDSLDNSLRKIITTVAEALRARYVGLWSFGPGRRTLTLLMTYDRRSASFSHGVELQCNQFPDYFRAVGAVRIEAITDVHTDPRLREFNERGYISDEIGALLNSTINVVSKQWGLLAVLHQGGPREWSDAEQWFATSIADLIAQLIAYGEIRRSERWLRFVADNLPIGVLKFDLDANCDYANPHWQHLLGIDANASFGQGWLQWVHPDDRAATLDAVRMVGLSGELGEGELRLRVRDKTIWAVASWVCDRNAEGFPIGVLGTIADVTHERALRENERRYRALFDNSGDAIFLMEGHRFIDCNVRTLEMFGCTREQIIGQRPYRFSPRLQPDGSISMEKAGAKIAAALAGDRQFFEWRYMRYDGTPFEAEVTLTCVTLNGEPHLLATVRDIGERKAAELALRQSIERLDRINNIAARLYGLHDVEAVARESVFILSGYGSEPIVTFFTYDEQTNRAMLVAQRDGRGETIAPTGFAIQWSALPQYDTEIELLSDIDSIHTNDAMREALRARGTRSVIYVWLRGENGRIGIIALEFREELVLEDALRNDLLAIGKSISMALANVLFIQHIEHQATHDTLTALPNRELLRRELLTLDLLSSANDATAEAGLMLLDLDRFKEVNDTLGHHLGDQLLIKLGQRLSELLREKNALLCRLGGDEFAVLVRDENPEQIQRTADVLLDSLRQPFQVDDLMLEIGGSIGIALYPQHGASGGKLLRLADVAMYQAKRSGSGSAVYDSELDLYTPTRLALMQELRAGIGGHQLVLYYQPKIDLRDDSVSGFEALARWQHPQRGLLAPGVFLPLAEMSDVIHALTIEVLEQALAQLREWSRRGLRYTIAVNLSVRNLINEHCFIQLRLLLDKYGVDPALLELEITETALMQDPTGASKLLDSLTALGVRFSIDDFGTGYSSLAYLRQLPIRALKIDRAFVADMVRNEQDAMIVKSTIALAHNLKLDVIAEGVEDEATLALLREMGCDFAQGYFISRPQPAEIIERWLGEHHLPRSARQ